MGIKLNEHDIEWLQDNYPGLKYDRVNSNINGALYFTREYKGVKISDNYEIEIKLTTKQGSIVPQVKEIGGKITNLSKKLNKKLVDLHINESDNTLCLAIYKREEEYFTNGFDIREFFKNLLEPFLFWISHYSKYEKAPWDEYAHGNLGHLELYAEGRIGINELKDIITTKELNEFKNLKGHHLCPCESGLKIKNCHKLIYNAAYKIKREL